MGKGAGTVEGIEGLRRTGEFVWVIDRRGEMRVPAVLYASEHLLKKAVADNACGQLVNVACLPGIARYALAMPDIHWGYGAPIGGVGGFSVEEGVVVPGFVGYDINCGVRLLRTSLSLDEIASQIDTLMDRLFSNVPSGVGSTGCLRVKRKELARILEEGARWAVARGYGGEEDLQAVEACGCLEGADPSALSDRAMERGFEQVGTLGSGNHFLEVQVVEEVYDEATASAFGLMERQIAVMVHTGSRGLGYQVCDDYLAFFGKVSAKYGIRLPDRQLAAAPISSPEGKKYLAAMKCAANYAFANRQVIAEWVRRVFSEVLGRPAERLGMQTVYDVAHNMAREESHLVDGKKTALLVHRKGATRAFAASHPDLPERYRQTGQPVIIPGTMGTSSYVLVGTQKAMEETWGSTCHGAGREMSRGEAIRRGRGRRIDRELASQGIVARASKYEGLAEEMPEAYKDVDEVVRVVEGAGISRKVCRMRPLGVMKG